MKRELVCPECAEVWLSIARKRYPGDHVRVESGRLKIQDCICDDCGEPLEVGAECYAVSVWTDDLTKRGRGYYEWENEYIVAGRTEDDLTKRGRGMVHGRGFYGSEKTEPAD